MTTTAIKWDRESIKSLLAKNNVAIERAILALYARQTASEQETDATHESNGRGFSAFDAEIFTKFAKTIESSRKPAGQRMEPWMYSVCRKPTKNGSFRIARYLGQILEIAQENGKAVETKQPRKIAA